MEYAVTVEEVHPMKRLRRIVNPGLETLIRGAGYSSLERFAEAVNHRGWHMRGVKTVYDHVTVQRWLAGGRSQNPDVVAAVLSDGWGIPMPVEVIWPELRDGQPSYRRTCNHGRPVVPSKS